jgi:hypothetical protein
VTLDELDVALEELETRLERLRALYEQYFLGFEKIEPAVARKDVDRRIYILRREKIRNTGRRFKLQTLIQRYNTYQQYWQRICREIENGTYRRHLLRAERLMSPEQQLTIASRRRFGKNLIAAVNETTPARESAASSSMPPPLDDDDFDHDAPTLPPPPPAARAVASSVPPRSTPSERARKLESLELDMGFLGDWDPDSPKTKSSPKAAPPPRPGARPAVAQPPRPAAAPRPPAAPTAATTPRGAPAAPPKPVAAPPNPAAPPPKPAAPPPKPGPPPKPARIEAQPSASPTAARPASMSDDRVKELHQKLVELKRQNHETGQVSLESLAKTLRDTEHKLRSEHKNRKIDFEVVVRDGKAIVKPTVR